jgi:signal transduction histidine kinase
MRNLQDYKAYDYQEEYIKFQNSKRDREQRMEIEQITADYNVNTAKKEVRLEERNKRLEAQRTFWLAGIIGLSIIFSLGYWLNINNLKRKNLALKLSQSELLQNQNIEKLKSESQVRILNATIDGKESERKQIAEILHDSVSALLSSANLHLQATKKQYNGSTPLEIIKTQEIIQEASHKVRDLSHNLMSSVLLKFGLTIAIRDIAEKYSNSVLTIDTEIIDLRRYSQNFEIKTYNIIQELINNILKHSKANNALIELKEQNSKLFLVISDDGIGFDKTKINLKEGIGINQIDVRIQMMKGKFHIESSANNGTKVTAEIPVIDQLEPNFV